MSTCVAYGCSNKADRIRKEKGITFHKFPHRDPERMKRWMLNMQRDNWTPSHCSKLCSLHFKEEHIDRTGQTVRLRCFAEPTIFDFQKKTSKRKQRVPNAISPPTVSPKKSARRKQPAPRRLPNLTDSSPVVETQEQTNCLKPPAPSGTLNLTDSAPVVESSTAQQQTSSHKPQAPRTLNLTNTSSVVEGTTPQQGVQRNGVDNCTYMYIESSTPPKEVEDQQIKKKNKCGEDHAYALMDSPSTLKRKWNRALDELAIYRKKLKVEQQRTRRLRKKVVSLKEVIESLRGQKTESTNSAEMLESSSFEIPEEFFEELFNI